MQPRCIILINFNIFYLKNLLVEYQNGKGNRIINYLVIYILCDYVYTMNWDREGL